MNEDFTKNPELLQQSRTQLGCLFFAAAKKTPVMKIKREFKAHESSLGTCSTPSAAHTDAQARQINFHAIRL